MRTEGHRRRAMAGAGGGAPAFPSFDEMATGMNPEPPKYKNAENRPPRSPLNSAAAW